MSDPLADLLDDVPNLRQDRDTGAVAYVRPSGVVLADAIRAALADGSLSLGDLGATPMRPSRSHDSHLSDPSEFVSGVWWRIPEGGER